MEGNSTYYDDVEDPFSETEETDYEQFYRLLRKISVFQMIMDIIQFFLCIGVIIVDIYLIVIICRNKKLKSSKTNKFVLHYAIFNILYFVTLPLFVISMEVFSLYRIFGWQMYCFEKQLEDVFMCGLFLCPFALAFEWLLTVYYNSNVKQIFRLIYNHSILVMYGFLIVYTISNIVFCNIGYFSAATALLDVILYICLLIFIIICNWLKKRVKNPTSKNTFSLTISTIMSLCWLPLFTYHFCEEIFRTSYTFRFILIVTGFIPQYLAYGSPIIIIIMLPKLNKYYKVAFTKSCSCSHRNYTGDDEIFEESEDETPENVNSFAALS